MSQSNSTKVSVLFIANLVNFLINFLLFPFLSRICTYEEYGTYSQLLLLGAFFLVIFNLGISTISNVVLAENEKKASVVFNTATNILGVVSVAGILIILLIGRQWNIVFNNSIFFSSLLYYIPALLLQSISSYFLNTALFYNKVKAIAIIIISTNILKMAMFLFSLYIVRSMAAVYISISLFTFLQCILLFFSLPKGVRQLTFKYDSTIASQLFTPAIPIMLTGLLGSGILYINGLYISNMLSVKDYAIYRNGAIEFPLVTVVTGSIMAVIMPAFAKLKVKQDIEELLSIKRRSSAIAAAIVFPVCIYLFFFSKQFIVLYLSDKYVESSHLFAIFNLALLIRFNSYQDILVVYKKTKTVLISNIIVFSISLILNFVLIKYFGLLGAVVSFLFSLFLLATLLTIFTCREVKIKIADYQEWGKLLKILVISILSGIVFFMIYNTVPTIIMLCAITIAYFTAIFIIFMRFNLVDRSYIDKYIGKLMGLGRVFIGSNRG